MVALVAAPFLVLQGTIQCSISESIKIWVAIKRHRMASDPLQKLNESMPQKGNNSSHLQAAVALFACLADTRNNVKVYAFVRQYIF
jgi:hypothetical protein